MISTALMNLQVAHPVLNLLRVEGVADSQLCQGHGHVLMAVDALSLPLAGLEHVLHGVCHADQFLSDVIVLGGQTLCMQVGTLVF